MVQRMCRFNVLKCPTESFGACELIGSFETESDAKRCEEESKAVDDGSIILIHKLEYDI